METKDSETSEKKRLKHPQQEGISFINIIHQEKEEVQIPTFQRPIFLSVFF